MRCTWASWGYQVFELTPEQFTAVTETFRKMAEALPSLTVAARRKYPEGSYERIAFEKLLLLVPKLEELRQRFLASGGSMTFTPEDRELVKEIATGMMDARAIIQETDFGAL